MGRGRGTLSPCARPPAPLASRPSPRLAPADNTEVYVTMYDVTIVSTLPVSWVMINDVINNGCNNSTIAQ